MILYIINLVERFKRLMSVATIQISGAHSASPLSVPAEWTAVFRADVPLVLEPRLADPFAEAAAALLETMPFALRVEDDASTIGEALAELPAILRDDAAMLARRFAALMGVDAVRVRVEAIAGDASRFDVFARLRHRRFPGGRALRTPALVLGMAYYRLRDWM